MDLHAVFVGNKCKKELNSSQECSWQGTKYVILTRKLQFFLSHAFGKGSLNETCRISLQ